MMEELSVFLESAPSPLVWWFGALAAIGIIWSMVGAFLFFLEYAAMILIFHTWLLIVLPYHLWKYRKDLVTGFWKSVEPFDMSENGPSNIPGPVAQLQAAWKKFRVWRKSNES